MSLGVGRRITTAAGSLMVSPGPGGLDQFGLATTPSGRPHMSPSGAGVEASASMSALADGVASAGFRSAPVTGTTRGGVDTADDSEWSMSRMSTSRTSTITVASPRCIAECAIQTWRTSAMDASATRCRLSMPVTLELEEFAPWRLRLSS